MKITIHQPNFMPYLGFFDKCDYADIIVLYNSTQFKKNDFQNRNRIRTKKGWIWLTVPVSYPFGTKINHVKISNSINWKEEHLGLIKENYSKSKFYKTYIDKIKEIYDKEWAYLSDFNITLIKFFFKTLGIRAKTVLSSEMGITTRATQALVDICKKLQATEYISGVYGKKYLEMNLFKKEKIKVVIQEYKHPSYNQVFEGFEPCMSILDLIFNEGPNSLNIIKSGRNYTK